MLRKREDWINLFRENLSIKLLALTLATITIFAIQRITNQTDEFEVPIQIEVESGMAILRQDARIANITCRGSLDDLRRLDQDQLRLVLRPKTAGIAGREQIPIGLRNVQGVPRSISVIKVTPNLLNVTYDREIEKQVSVARPELVGKPAIGRAEIDFTPKIIKIRGPQQLLEEVKIMRTPPIDIENATVSFSRQLPLLTDDEMGVWQITPNEIVARVNIVTEAINREFEKIPIMILRNPNDNLVFKPTPPTVNINLLGSPQAVNQIEKKEVRVFIDCTTITEPGTYEVTAAAHFERSADVSIAVNPPLIDVVASPIQSPPEPASTNVVQAATPAEDQQAPTPEQAETPTSERSSNQDE